MSSLGRWAPALVAAASLALFVATACPTIPFGDGGELIAAAHAFGVAHPPGYALYTALGWLALKIPFGEPAFRMNLMSSLFGALACGGVTGLALRVTRSPLAAAAAGLGLALSSTFWSVATVTEVYTLHLLFLVLLLSSATTVGSEASTRERGRAMLLGAVFLGLGLGHHPTILLALPSAILLAGPRREAGERIPRVLSLLAVALIVALPVAMALTLMLRARAHPVANWGRPENVPALIAHVTARRYAVYDLGWGGVLRLEAWKRLVRLLFEELSFAGPLLAAGGFAFWRREGSVKLRLALALLGSLTVLFGLRYATEDVEVFFLPAVLALSVAAGLGIAALQHRRGPWARMSAVLAAILLVVPPAAMHCRSRNLRGMTAAADAGRDMLATIPQRGVLFVEGDDAFLLAYRTEVLGERPDVALYDRAGNLFRDLLFEDGPPLAPGESLPAYRMRREREFIARELGAPASRPVLFMSWPGYELSSGTRFEPVGLFYQVRLRDDAPVENGALWASYRDHEIVRQALRAEDPFALTIAATYPLMRGERALFLGKRSAALAAFREASSLARGSETIHNTLGTIYGRLGEYSRAAREFEEAVRIKPVSRRAWSNLGQARLLQGDREGARRAWRRSLALDPGQADVAEQLRALQGGSAERR